MRVLGVLLLGLVLLTGCGDRNAEPVTSEPEASETVPSPQVSTPGGEGPAGQPPIDGPLPDRRTGNVPLAKCFDGVPTFGFDGTVTAVEGGRATFSVHESFFGDVPDTVVVDLGPPVTAGHSEASPSYSVGTRMLVQGAHDRAGGCGDTRYYDEETAAAWRS